MRRSPLSGVKQTWRFARGPLSRSLLGAKQTWVGALHMSAFDPKRTSDVADPLPLLLAMLKLPYPPPSDRGGFPLLLIMAGTHLQSRRQGTATCQTKPQRVPPC